MKQAELIQLIEQTAPLCLAAPWDHCGVQVASGRGEVSHLAVCLDPVSEQIAKALDLGADMILSHHPLAMEPRFTDRLDDFHAVLALLFKADVPLYSAHTSLDANPEGPVAWLAHELALRPLDADRFPHVAENSQPARHDSNRLTVLEHTAVLEQGGMSCPCGFGLVGDLPCPLAQADFVRLLAPWLRGSSVRLAGGLPEMIRRVAICPGSGSSLAVEAAALGADVLITGDLKHHTALGSPLPILDVGHFCLEEEMMRRFAEQLSGAGIRVSFVPGCDPLQPLSVC